MSYARMRAAVSTGLLAATIGGGLLAAPPAHAVAGGSPVPDGAYRFVAKLDIGESRSCTGALIAPRWILTAASCFADPGQPGAAIPGGPPKQPTTVTIGRAHLVNSAGPTVKVTDLVPRADRNLVLARLVTAVTGITAIKIGTASPATGEVLRVAGYGRTGTEWVPDQLHSATFAVGNVTATSLEIAGHTPATASTCKGDSGGPAFREHDGLVELVAINNTSWQAGCFGETETRQGATETRVDDLADWIRESTTELPVAGAGGLETTSAVRWADFDGDRKPDYVVINANGSIRVFLNRGGYRRGGWADHGQVAGFSITDPSKIYFADFDGDGKADYVYLNDQGNVFAYLNRGGVGHGGWTNLGKVAGFSIADRSKVRFADFDGDGRADYVYFNDQGNVFVYLNRGGDGRGGWTNLGRVAGFSIADRTKIRLADFDGDGKTDYAYFNAQRATLVYFNRGGEGRGGWINRGQVTGARGVNTNESRFVDFDGDRKADHAVKSISRPVVVYLNRGGDGQGGWENHGAVTFSDNPLAG